MDDSTPSHGEILHRLAHKAMADRGLEPDVPAPALAQAASLRGPAVAGRGDRDLIQLPWASIDNDDSRDLDQLTCAEPVETGTRVMVAVADVDALAGRGSAIDRHARANTTTVYTAGGIFPMLPLRLSNDLTSLNPDEDRRAVVISFVVDEDGAIGQEQVFSAMVRNKAKLAYGAVGAWLQGEGPLPTAGGAPGVADQLRMQDGVSRTLRRRRHEIGALDLETLEPNALMTQDGISDLVLEPKNRAHELIEDLMVAANTASTRFLAARGMASLRRVVRTPQRWQRIQTLATDLGDELPHEPDSRALNEFLRRRRAADPLRFPDLSLAVVKLIGSGEYVVQQADDLPIGHFGLAVKDYSHSTAPNRRYPDLLTQRLLKAAIAGTPAPYSVSALRRLAEHCTRLEDEVRKIERHVLKAAAALLLRDRIGERFEGLVTGASSKGTWVRILDPPVEGKVVQREAGLDVGDRTAVLLLSVDVERGFIDFAALP